MNTNRLRGRVFHLASIILALLVLGVLAFAVQIPEQALNKANPRVQEIMAVQEAVTPDLMSIPDVLGTAVGEDFDGEMALLVYVNLEGKNPGAAIRSIPPRLRGKRVTIELTDPFRAMVKGKPPGKPDKPGKPDEPGDGEEVDHRAIQDPPIQLGTSGGWRYDIANGYCCGGTLGSLIQVGGTQYILSNYHVFESDIVLGGNNRVATTGDPVIQPGLIDVGCDAAGAQDVATLVISSSLSDHNVDASIAKIISGQVSPDGSILEIGTISAETVDAYISQAVKKSGRTTGLSRSKITGLNGTVMVSYDYECAGGTAFTKTFTGQIMIANKRSKFLAGGDSGSLMVEDVDANPRAVGLLYAGSKTLAVANPIDEVLDFFDATMVGY